MGPLESLSADCGPQLSGWLCRMVCLCFLSLAGQLHLIKCFSAIFPAAQRCAGRRCGARPMGSHAELSRVSRRRPRAAAQRPVSRAAAGGGRAPGCRAAAPVSRTAVAPGVQHSTARHELADAVPSRCGLVADSAGPAGHRCVPVLLLYCDIVHNGCMWCHPAIAWGHGAWRTVQRGTARHELADAESARRWAVCAGVAGHRCGSSAKEAETLHATGCSMLPHQHRAQLQRMAFSTACTQNACTSAQPCWCFRCWCAGGQGQAPVLCCAVLCWEGQA